MTFREVEPIGGTIDPSNTIELWDGDRQVATIYAQASGVHVVCMAGWEPDSHGMTIERRPGGIMVGLRRDEDTRRRGALRRIL